MLQSYFEMNRDVQNREDEQEDEMDLKRINIGILGIGNVGIGTIKALEMNRASIEKSTRRDIRVTKVLARDIHKKRDIELPDGIITADASEILDAPDIDIVVELLGGAEPAASYMEKALKQGKHVVTANKAALAANYDKLLKTAEENHKKLLFEASVAGGIPVINAIATVLRGNQFEEVSGILNGTTNYILTNMTEHALPYDEVLKSAQEKGFAEADPTADVCGIDAANKLSILMALAFDKYVHPDDIPTEGITEITADDIEDAKKRNAKIKLLATARNENGTLSYEVKPTLLDVSHPLAGVSNEFNAVFVRGNAVGELMFYGKGAGPLPTGSAVLGDIISIAENL